MPDYRAYILGREGLRFLRVTEFFRDHADDATALCAAKKLVDGHDVELWDGGRGGKPLGIGAAMVCPVRSGQKFGKLGFCV